MTVILVVLLLTAFLLIDHFRHARYRPAQQALTTAKDAVPRPVPLLVSGFQVPDNLRYHPGHTWALGESPTLVRVGMDEFASKLAGKVERISLPQRGQWIRQGQKLCTLLRAGKSVDMLSPMEGSVADINEAVVSDPEQARQDPYGEGWLMTFQAPEAKISFRNLLGGALARSWMEESASRLRQKRPLVVGELAQDGGIAVDDIISEMAEQDWAALTREFFLS